MAARFDLSTTESAMQIWGISLRLESPLPPTGAVPPDAENNAVDGGEGPDGGDPLDAGSAAIDGGRDGGVEWIYEKPLYYDYNSSFGKPGTGAAHVTIDHWKCAQGEVCRIPFEVVAALRPDGTGELTGSCLLSLSMEIDLSVRADSDSVRVVMDE